MSSKGITLMFSLHSNLAHFKDIFCMICIFNESWRESSNLLISNGMKIWPFWKKNWSHHNLACWKDTFEKKTHLIYTIWFTWRYFLLLYESLRDSNYFSSSSTSFWTCNHYWREKYKQNILIIKCSVDSQLSKYCNTYKKNSLGKTCSCFGIYLEIHYLLNESTQITRTRWS